MQVAGERTVCYTDSETDEHGEDETMDIHICVIDRSKSDSDEWITSMNIGGCLIPFKLDTGSQVNILPENDFNSIQNRPKIHKKKMVLKTYSGEPIYQQKGYVE